MPSPDDDLNNYNSPQLSVEVGMISIEAYVRSYVATDVQLLVSLLGGEDQRDFQVLRPSAAKMKL
jgi:hypothetical protein